MTVAGVEIADHIFAAGFLALLIAGQCLRNALWANGHAWFGEKSSSPQPVLVEA